MAGSIIKIKRSVANGAPGALEYGELAYSGKSDTHKLFIGMYGTGVDSNNILVTPIGGKFYTDLLDVTPGTLTSSKALIVDSNGKLNQFKVDDLLLNGNVVSTSTADTDLQLNANGTGVIQFYDSSNSYWFPRERGDAGKVLTRYGSSGETRWESVAVNLNMNADAGTDTSINLLTSTLKFRGLDGISTVFNNDTLQIFGVQATSSQLGVASFEANDFDIDTSAHVSLKKERIQDYVGEMIDNGLATNMTASYNDDNNRLEFSVNIASTSQKGIAQFSSSHFTFPTAGNVSLKDNIVQTITVPSGSVVVSSNTLVLADGTGIAISGTGSNTLTIAAVKATDTVFGVAKFAESYFDMGTAGVVKIRPATTSALGIAQFNTNNFTVSAGEVSSKSFTIGDVEIDLGDTNVTDLTGLTSVEVGNLKLSGSTLEQTLTNTDIVVKPLGTISGRAASIKIDTGIPDTYWVLPATRGTGGAEITNEVLTINKETGVASWEAPNQDLTVYGDNASGEEVLTVGTESIKFTGSQGIATITSAVTGQVVVTIQGQKASTNSLGVAQFSDASFAVSDGVVTIKANGVSNTQLANKTIGIGSTPVTLGDSETNFAGLHSLALAKIKIGAATSESDELQGTITAVGTNKNLYLTGTGSGNVWVSGAYALPNVDGTNGQVIITDGAGNLTWDTPAVSLDVAGGTGSGTIDLLEEVLTITGSSGITTSFDSPSSTFTITGVLANDSGRVGVSSFTGAQFDVNGSGVVSLTDGGITNAKLANKSITIGSTSVDLGTTITALVGMTGITTGNLEIGTSGGANTIKAVNSGPDGDILLRTKGDGDITFFSGSDYSYSLPKSQGTANYVLTTLGNGRTEWAQPVSTIRIANDGGNNDTINLNGGTLLFKNGVATTVAIGTDSVTINSSIATTSSLGVASYAATQFAVSGGGSVTLVDSGIQDIVGAMIGDTTDITVEYADHALNFTVATATKDVKGVAKFNEGDFVVNGEGAVSLDGTVLQSISGDSGTAAPNSNSLSIVGDGVIGVTAADDTVTVSVDVATPTTLGVASFPTTYFGVSAGVVSINTATSSTKGIASFSSDHFTVSGGGVSINTQTLGDQTIRPGTAAITAINGLTQVTAGKLVISGYEISYNSADAAADGDISLNPKGDGVVSVGGARITNVGTPQTDTDAANKAYVDAAKAGLTIKDPVRVASTDEIDLTYTLATPPIIDTIPLNSGDRVLVKNQGQVGTEQATTDPDNGIWVWTLTGGSSAWARSTDADTGPEMVAGMFMFVQEGDTQQDTGWVLGTDVAVTINTTPLKFVQFSAAGTIQVASSGGLLKAGQVLSINLPITDSALEINGSNQLVVANAFAGAGLTLTNGVLDVVGTSNRITVTANAIDISASYAGQSSITTVGTIASGIWNGTAIGAAYGGTGVTSTNKGDLLIGNSSNGWSIKAMNGISNVGKVLQVVNTGTLGSPVYEVEYADIDGGEY